MSEMWTASSCGRGWMKDEGACWLSQIYGATGYCGGCGCGCIQRRVINCWGGQHCAKSSRVTVNLMGLVWVTCKS